MIKKVFRLSIFIGLFYGCDGPGRINITGRYFLESAEGGKYEIGYQVDDDGSYLTLVELYVFAAGYNDKYIVAKQHPRHFEDMRSDSVYYIVPIHNEYTQSPQDGIIGPLTIEEYKIKSNELKINRLDWRL